MPTTRGKSAGRTSATKRTGARATNGRRSAGARGGGATKSARNTTARESAPAASANGRRTAAKKSGARATSVGMGLHIGLNAVDPRHYGGWSGKLVACENDANDMAAVARTRGMTPTMLLTKNATRQAVLRELRKAARK